MKNTNHGNRTMLAVVIVLLIGVVVWGVAGRLPDKVDVAAIADDGVVTLYVSEADIAGIVQDNTVYFGKKEYSVIDIADEPIIVDENFAAYALHIGGLTVGEWVYPVTVNADLPDGTYEVSILKDGGAPISFLSKWFIH